MNKHKYVESMFESAIIWYLTLNQWYVFNTLLLVLLTVRMRKTGHGYNAARNVITACSF